MERHGYGPEVARALKEAYRLLYRGNLNVGQAVEQMRAQLPDIPEIDYLVSFVTQSSRGIIK
jgi:UDP-N-acetylglucosamine acyltransferase